MEYFINFNPKLAVAVGIEKAILIKYIRDQRKDASVDFIVSNNIRYYNATSKWLNVVFPFMAQSTISRMLKELVNDRYLYAINNNSNDFDRSKWYAVTSKVTDISRNKSTK